MNKSLTISMDILDYAVSRARKNGADHAVAIAGRQHSSTLRFALNQITQHMESMDTQITISVAVDQKEAMIQTNILEKSQLDCVVDQVIEYARQAPRNNEFVAPVGPCSYQDVQTFFASTAAVTLEQKLKAVDRMFRIAETRNILLFGNLSIVNATAAGVNSSGLSVSQPYTEMVLRLTARSLEGAGSGMAAVHEADFDRFDFDGAAESAVSTADRSRHPVRYDPGRYTVVMTSEAVLEYLMFMLHQFDANRAETGQSFFSDRNGAKTKIGQKLIDPRLTLQSVFDDPRMPYPPFGIAFGGGGSNTGAYFSYGLPYENYTWFENGVLKRLRDSAYNAVKNGRQPVAVPYNLVMNGGTETAEEIIRSTPKGILISSFWYTSMTDGNSLDVTGLTRDGTFLIEDGQITRPLMNFRFNDSPIRSLNSISAIGSPRKALAEYIMGIVPPLRIEGFHLSSVSGAV